VDNAVTAINNSSPKGSFSLDIIPRLNGEEFSRLICCSTCFFLRNEVEELQPCSTHPQHPLNNCLQKYEEHPLSPEENSLSQKTY
jgi:hypothetical protein